MTDLLKPAIVRIRNPERKIVGTGFLVSSRHVLTCAHVVDQAETPGREIHLDFPFLPEQPGATAWVVSRQPGCRLDRYPPDDGLDVALLGLHGGRPEGSRPAPLIQPGSVADHRFRAYGFPGGLDGGIWIYGTLRDTQANGWGQLDAEAGGSGYFVTPGCSGAPVWDDTLQGIVGMVVAADRTTGIKAAFMIPTPMLLNAAPELAVSEVGRELKTRNTVLLLRPYATQAEAREQQRRDLTTFVLPALKQAGLTLTPAEPRDGIEVNDISPRLIQQVSEAGLVVVDANCWEKGGAFTLSPYLFYFIALRHARGAKTLLVCRSDAHLPHSLQKKPHTLTYSPEGIVEFWETFTTVVARIQNRSEDEPGNPVEEYEERRATRDELARVKSALAAERTSWARALQDHLKVAAGPSPQMPAEPESSPPRTPSEKPPPRRPGHSVIHWKPVDRPGPGAR